MGYELNNDEVKDHILTFYAEDPFSGKTSPSLNELFQKYSEDELSKAASEMILHEF